VNPTKVLVVDDSAFMRKMLTEIIGSDERFVVVGNARDGVDALMKVDQLHPDVITLDVEMPVMDGYTTLVELMKRRPMPVVMISSRTQAGAEITMRCLSAGAVDFVAKPHGPISLDIANVASDILAKIAVASQSRPHRDSELRIRQAQNPVLIRQSSLPRPGLRNAGIIVIGASTGGPRALHTLIPALEADFPIPGVIIQHMPPGFTQSLAKRLDFESRVAVREATDGEELQAGTFLLAPGGVHLVVDEQHTTRLITGPPLHGVRPAVDITLESVARVFGDRTIAVLLTGMGRDGARGMKALHDLGAQTFAEDESTCVVYGMPRAAMELGGVGAAYPLGDLPAAVSAAARNRFRTAA
jgi:two-component system chemotaxis response regulator CheB